MKRQVENVLIVIVKEFGKEDSEKIRYKDIIAETAKHHLAKSHIKTAQLLAITDYALY